VGPRAGLNVTEKRKISCPYWESNPDSLVIQPRSLVCIPTGSFPGVKRQGHEGDHSPPSSTEVRMVELYLHSPIHIHCMNFCNVRLPASDSIELYYKESIMSIHFSESN
jgi:hypothetical protein